MISILSIVFFASGLVLISYPSYATSMGLPIGNMFYSNGNRLAFLGAGLMLIETVSSFISNGLLSSLITIVVGFLLAFVCTYITKSIAQGIGLILTIVGYIYFLIHSF